MNNYEYTNKDIEIVLDCAKKSAWKISYGDYEKFEDYYSLALVGAAKAIKTYNKDNGVLLKTYAYTCIRNEIFIYIKKKRIVADLSLDYTVVSGPDPLYLRDLLKADLDIEDEVIYNDLLDVLYNNTNNLLTKSESRLIRVIIENPYRSQQEIGDILNCSRQNVSSMLQKIRVKLQKMLQVENV